MLLRKSSPLTRKTTVTNSLLSLFLASYLYPSSAAAAAAATAAFAHLPSCRAPFGFLHPRKLCYFSRSMTSNSSSRLYSTSSSSSSSVSSRRPLVICGPSGAGKGTLIKMLLTKESDRYGFTVSHTTRGPRPGEEEGKDYHFTTREIILENIAAGKFLEHATVHGNLYGTSFDAIRKVQDAGKICILDIDVQGVVSVKAAAKRIRDLMPIYVFIAPPSMEILESRLRGRETEKEEDVLRRLANARQEVEYGLKEGSFDKVVVNNDLEQAYAELKGYIDLMYNGEVRRATP